MASFQGELPQSQRHRRRSAQPERKVEVWAWASSSPSNCPRKPKMSWLQLTPTHLLTPVHTFMMRTGLADMGASPYRLAWRHLARGGCRSGCDGIHFIPGAGVWSGGHGEYQLQVVWASNSRSRCFITIVRARARLRVPPLHRSLPARCKTSRRSCVTSSTRVSKLSLGWPTLQRPLSSLSPAGGRCSPSSRRACDTVHRSHGIWPSH